MARNCRARFLDNNFNGPASSITYSSQQSLAPASNTTHPDRGKVWLGAGNFEVTAARRLIYINDGADKTIALDVAAYTAATLATEIQTKLNALSSNWTCTYSTTTRKFTIDRSSGVEVLRFSVTASAAWDMLGYTAVVNDSTGPFEADRPRIHTSEWYELDRGVSLAFPAFCAVSPLGLPFGLSATATIRIMADNIPGNWATPALNHTVLATELSDTGIFAFLDEGDGSEPKYRYLRFEYIDRANPGGPDAIAISHLYFGDYVTLTLSNVATGFVLADVDPSEETRAQNGAKFFNEQAAYRRFSSMTIEYIQDATERLALQRALKSLGRTSVLYLALDPTLEISETTAELTAFGRFTSDPSLTHFIRDIYTLAFDFEEAI